MEAADLSLQWDMFFNLGINCQNTFVPSVCQFSPKISGLEINQEGQPLGKITVDAEKYEYLS